VGARDWGVGCSHSHRMHGCARL